MPDKKAFTLMELIIVMIIIGILVAVALPNYTNMMTLGAAKAAQNNLMTIYNAQKNYYLSPATGGTYYTSSGNPDDLAGINTALGLTIAANNFKYTCATAAGPSFTCTATNNTDANLILTISSGVPGTPNPIVLPGGTTCASNTGVNPGCNPSCATDVNAFCPT